MDFTPLHDYLAGLIAKGVPGCELIVSRNHEIIFHECLGVSDDAKAQPASPVDRYWMYSCTKPVTVTTAMRCIELGMFGLDDPVAKYLPAFASLRVKTESGSVPAKHTMTIRHLFTMTGGLNYDLHRPAVKEVMDRTGGMATTVEVAQALTLDPLEFEPGTDFRYSLCHDVLAAVCEAASGMTFRDCVKKFVLDPLEMTRTDFWTEGVPEDMAAQYTYHGKTGEVNNTGLRNHLLVSPNYYSGGAGLVSCAEDYIKFTDAMACGGVGANGVRILQEESVKLLRTVQLHRFDLGGTISKDYFADYGYGLGVRVRRDMIEGVATGIGEFGWDGAAGADTLIDPVNHISLTYVQHVLNWPEMLGTLHVQIRNVLYPLLDL